MAKNNKISMPSSGAGLTTFYDESDSKVFVSPQTVLFIVVFIAALMIFLNILI